MRLLICLLFGHTPERGLNRKWCYRYHCVRCGVVARGDL